MKKFSIVLTLIALAMLAASISEAAIFRLDDVGKGRPPGVYVVVPLGSVELGVGGGYSEHFPDDPAVDEAGLPFEAIFVPQVEATVERKGFFGRARSDLHKSPVIRYGLGFRWAPEGVDWVGLEGSYLWAVRKLPRDLEFGESSLDDPEVGLNFWLRF